MPSFSLSRGRARANWRLNFVPELELTASQFILNSGNMTSSRLQVHDRPRFYHQRSLLSGSVKLSSRVSEVVEQAAVPSEQIIKSAKIMKGNDGQKEHEQTSCLLRTWHIKLCLCCLFFEFVVCSSPFAYIIFAFVLLYFCLSFELYISHSSRL